MRYKKQIRAFLFTSLFIVLSSFGLILLDFQKHTTLQAKLIQTEHALTTIDSLGHVLLQVESDKRGFQLTGDASYLVRFFELKQETKKHVAALHQYSSLVPGRQIEIIDSLSALRLNNLDSGVLVYTTKGLDAAIAFMQLKSKRDLRIQLTGAISSLKESIHLKAADYASHIERVRKRNIGEIFIALSIFVVLMVYAAIRFSKAQQRVIATHNKFKEAQRIAKIGSWEWDFASGKVIWSHEEYSLFGEDYKSYEPSYENYLSHLSKKDQEHARQMVRDALAGLSRYTLEHEIIRGDGARLMVFEQGSFLYNEQGQPIGMFGTTQDISERKAAEEELKIAKKKIQSIIDNTADGIYQSTLDGRFLMVNNSMARIFGYDSPEEMIHSVDHIGRQLYADPSQRKRMTEMIVLNDHVNDFELQAYTKDRKTIWVSANIRCVRDSKGAVRYFEGTLENITSRKLAEAQLKSLSNRLQLAVRATGIGIWDWDITIDHTVWDEEVYRIYNADPLLHEEISLVWDRTVHPDDIERVKEELQMAIRGEKEYDTEFRVIWKDNSVHHVKGNALVIRNESGTAMRMIGTNTDITERKQAEEEILQLNRNLDQFANITAHDLQEPIRMVSGFLGLLHKKYHQIIDEQGRLYIDRAKDGADRMSILIRDLLEYSRSGNKEAKKELVDLSMVMDLVDRDLSIVMADTGTVLRIPEELPIVKGTQSALYRLLLNLVSNGIKFRKPNIAPIIDLTITEEGDMWEFKLQDNGIGIAAKDMPKLFQAFQRLHRRDQYPGTGLGLVTCKKIVETHGGRIWVTSEPGEGTCFYFTLAKADVFEEMQLTN